MLIFTVVFSFFVKIPTDGIPYSIFAYTALLAWTLLATSINFGAPSLVNNMDLLTKIYFPREVLPTAPVFASVLDFLLGLVVFVVLLIVFGVPLAWTMLWVPVILIIQIVLLLGIVLLVSGLNVFYRDIKYVIPLGLQLWFYATPIIYPISVVPEWLRPFYILNPLAGIVDSYRKVILLQQAPSTLYLGTATMIAFMLAVFGYFYFKRVEWQFADVI
jgi:lipopolysaccharide transport system permease protein